MQFLLIARDGDDPETPQRRQKSRSDHLAAMARLKAAGHFVFGGATLDEQGNMNGSAIVFDFSDRAVLDDYLRSDPYVIEKVWGKIDIYTYRLAKVD